VRADWTESRFRYEAVVSGGQVDPRAEPWASMVLVAPNHLESGTGKIVGRQTAREQGVDSGKYVVAAGDVLYSKIRPALNKAAIAVENCLCSADMYAISFRDRVDTRFALYFMLGKPFHEYATAMSMRVKMPKVNREDLADAPWLLPTLREQRAIADYLDLETGRIDTLIKEQQRLIETLKERKRGVVDAVVTRGLDPRVVLADSGVEWLGPIPAHWEIRPLWSMFERIKDVGHPEEQMLSVFRDYGVVSKDSRENINKTAENRNIYQLVHPGWLVTNRMKAWQGSVGISTLRGIVSGHYICFAPCHREDARYLNWLFRSPRYAVGYGLISRGVRIGQAEIDNDDYRVLPVLIPPPDEQERIVAELDAQTSTIDGLIGETERLIELARERRSALITAAVTGQIDIGTAEAAELA
jgi:type I restriction enzyme, S subunit